VGSGIYLAGAWAMRISEVNEVVDMVRRRVFRRSVTTT